MNLLQLHSPPEATRTKQLFRWVIALGGLSWVSTLYLSSLWRYFPLGGYLVGAVGVGCQVLFPFLTWRLLWRAAQQLENRNGERRLLKLSGLVFLLLGVLQVLVPVLILLFLLFVPIEFPARTDGDSFFG
ncbi:hypothetical protein [Hymenobacter volaticus]|uniref:Uncharacterized protein n=1 Tax=Hymenobacter volaticus TaxID=2932254 RepID=A0ABY4G416_9BACT|nr:hypothetical protein [Hymenobacter volaticus]UOQ65389.1 hypothetical protein MUN86_17805 [Hymenobacter volaticus]